MTNGASAFDVTPANLMPFRLDHLDAVEPGQKIEMPIGAPQFTVGDRVKSDLLLPGDDRLDLGVLDLLQRGGRQLPGRMLAARLLQARRPQQRTNVVGAVGWSLRCMCKSLPVLTLEGSLKSGTVANSTLYSLPSYRSTLRI